MYHDRKFMKTVVYIRIEQNCSIRIDRTNYTIIYLTIIIRDKRKVIEIKNCFPYFLALIIIC